MIRSSLRKICEKGVIYYIRRLTEKISLFFKKYARSIFWGLENFHGIIMPSRSYSDSLLAIYDFRMNPYSFNFVEFLARAEVYRVEHSLSSIDLVFVVDKEKLHRGDQPEVTNSNYRNWILNLAESAEPLKSIGSISLFDDKHKFLIFYRKAHYTHKIYPQTGAIYHPQASYHLKYVSDYYRATGFVPKFESSAVLLKWAEKYFLQNSHPLIPVVVFIRNSKSQPTRNAILPVWFDFFRKAAHEYPVKFFVINDFWNPVDIPADLAASVMVSPEATISVKHRTALTQKSSFIVTAGIGSFMYCHFTDTPFLLFGWDNDIFSAEFNITKEGLNDDFSFPWATKYQKGFPKFGDTEYIFLRFKELYDLLKKDNHLVPDYYSLKQKDIISIQA